MVLLYIGIDDLLQVKQFLKKFNNWQSLGLELGLLYPTLEGIDEEQRGVIDKCKTKMLAAWLRQQDNVRQVGTPSWGVLQRALESIEENELASKISTWDMVSCGQRKFVDFMHTNYAWDFWFEWSS